MSLVGNLEDLGLADILQIVSLSRKSGKLILAWGEREGGVVFRSGEVIQAQSTGFRSHLGDLLLNRSLCDLATLKKAVALYRKQDGKIPLQDILVERFEIPRASLEEAVREQIEKIVYSFFDWTGGTFSFELGETPNPETMNSDPFDLLIEPGLNPQWLAMEGSRILDERIHRGEPAEEEDIRSEVDFKNLLESAEDPEAPAEAGAVEAGEETPPIFVVDDDGLIRRALGKSLRSKGFHVESFEGGQEFLTAVKDAVDHGRSPVLLIDLLLPRMDGSGILGGLDLLDSVRKKFPQLSALVLSDHPNDLAERKLRRLGVPSVLPKPGKEELRQGRGRKILEKVAETVASLVEAKSGGRGASSALFNLGEELLREFGEEPPREGREKEAESPGLHLLKGMLQELSNPSLGGGITLLVLRFASELMNRAVIFMVKEKEIVGLGQFGIEFADGQADARVRRMKIPRDEGSCFDPVLREMSARTLRLGSGRWDDYLRKQLGGEHPEEVFLGPIISEGRVVAIIYGDNLPERNPIGETESIEIFLSQAGLAMEKALLERRLRGMDAV